MVYFILEFACATYGNAKFYLMPTAALRTAGRIYHNYHEFFVTQ